jgi:hypothetical protein
MKILWIGSLHNATGNNTTSLRIANHLIKANHQVILRDAQKDFTAEMDSQNYDMAIGIHAFHSGKILTQLAVRSLP